MHIGYERFYDDAYVQAKEALEKAGRIADIIIMPGDIFDKRSPKPEVIAQAINIFRELSKRNWQARVTHFDGRNGSKSHTTVPIIGISGTHERTAFGKDNPLNLLGLAGFIVDTSEATTIIEKGDEKVAIFGLGGLSEERVKETLVELDPKPVMGAFNIFMFHQSTYELLPFSSDFIHNNDLPKGFDLYVDGHIHSRVDMEVHGKKFLIPGSTVLTQLKDGEQEEKGFILFDTQKYSYEFVKINSRQLIFKTIQFNKIEPKGIKERCEKEIDGILEKSRPKPIIRLKLQGTIRPGFNGTDMQLQSLILKYATKAVIDIDKSKLSDPDVESSIEGLRDSRIGDVPIKELGMSILASKLKELKLESNIDYAELFSILSDGSKKEKVLKAAVEFIDSSTAS